MTGGCAALANTHPPLLGQLSQSQLGSTVRFHFVLLILSSARVFRRRQLNSVVVRCFPLSLFK